MQLSHRALLANREQTAALRPAPVTPVDRVLLAVPLFHSYGVAAGFLQVCWAGATVVLAERLEPAQLVEVLVEQRVSTVAGVPVDLPRAARAAGRAAAHGDRRGTAVHLRRRAAAGAARWPSSGRSPGCRWSRATGSPRPARW